MCDTDIDQKSIQFATRNVQDNGLQTRIKILQTQATDQLLAVALDKLGLEKYVFHRCFCIIS